MKKTHTNDEESNAMIEKIFELCEKYNFDVLVFPGEDGYIDGFLIGTEEFVDTVENNLESDKVSELFEDVKKSTT